MHATLFCNHGIPHTNEVVWQFPEKISSAITFDNLIQKIKGFRIIQKNVISDKLI